MKGFDESTLVSPLSSEGTNGPGVESFREDTTNTQMDIEISSVCRFPFFLRGSKPNEEQTPSLRHRGLGESNPRDRGQNL